MKLSQPFFIAIQVIVREKRRGCALISAVFAQSCGPRPRIALLPGAPPLALEEGHLALGVRGGVSARL